MCKKPAQVQHSRKECVYLVCVFTLSQCRMWFDIQSKVKNVVALAQYGHAVDLIPHLHYKPRSQFKHAHMWVVRLWMGTYLHWIDVQSEACASVNASKRSSERARTNARMHTWKSIRTLQWTHRTVFAVSKNVSIFIWLWWMNDTIKN